MSVIKLAGQLIRERSARLGINHDIRRMAREVAGVVPSHDPERTLVSFNASSRITGLSLNAAYAMLAGWSLRLQGVRVVNFACLRGMPRCVLGTNREDIYKSAPCEKCVKQSEAILSGSELAWMTYYPDEALVKKLSGIDLGSLQSFTYEDIPLGELCLPSIRWILRRHHLEDTESTRTLYRNYILSAYNIAGQFDKLVRVVHPLSVMVFNGMQFPEATARWVARKHGLPVYSHEVGMRPFSAFFTAGDATAYPVDIPNDFKLTPEQNQQLDGYLSKRFKGDFSMAGVAFWPEMTGLGEDFLAKMETFRQVVPVFTNVIFDTSQPHANVLFPHMFAWLDEILDVARKHPETLFVVRAHPDESRPGKASQESVAAWVRERDADGLPNLIFVGPDDYFSSYEMIQRAKFVMIYNSTIGMEASIMGAPVLCAGKARFTQLETVFFPKSKAEYLTKLEEFLSAGDVKPPAEHQRNARRFLYYQLFRTSLPFDRFLETDGVWPGFVRLKAFDCQDLLPENSPTLKVITDGLLEGKPFLLPE